MQVTQLVATLKASLKKKGIMLFWFIYFILIVVDCGTLNDPANGRVSHTAGTTFEQTATYSCNTGYNLVGGSTRTCQASGAWSGNAPTCEGRSHN